MPRKHALALLTAAACVACTSNSATTSGRHLDTGTRDDRSSFCALARKVGAGNLKLSSVGTTTDPDSLLAGIDSLDAAAPASIRADFHTFDRFEHAVLRPGSNPAAAVPGNRVGAALAHVAGYLQSTCKIT
jgi:hypothetical protein